MEESILKSTKKILGLDAEYTPFDLDVVILINAAFSLLNQLGVGPRDGFSIENEEAKWEDYRVPSNQLNLVKTYIYLKVRVAFDPPGTSFLLESMNNQIKEHEWRLNSFREFELSIPIFLPPAFDISIVYNPGDIVSHNGANWIALDPVMFESQPGIDVNYWEPYLLAYIPEEVLP